MQCMFGNSFLNSDCYANFFVWLVFFFTVIIQNGPDERSIPGNTIAVQANMPFSGLTTFGSAFLSKFECSQMPHPVSYATRLYLYIKWSELSHELTRLWIPFPIFSLSHVSCWSTSHLLILLEFYREKNNEHKGAMILREWRLGLLPSVISFFFCLILTNLI